VKLDLAVTAEVPNVWLETWVHDRESDRWSQIPIEHPRPLVTPRESGSSALLISSRATALAAALGPGNPYVISVPPRSEVHLRLKPRDSTSEQAGMVCGYGIEAEQILDGLRTGLFSAVDDLSLTSEKTTEDPILATVVAYYLLRKRDWQKLSDQWLADFAQKHPWIPDIHLIRGIVRIQRGTEVETAVTLAAQALRDSLGAGLPFFFEARQLLQELLFYADDPTKPSDHHPLHEKVAAMLAADNPPGLAFGYRGDDPNEPLTRLREQRRKVRSLSWTARAQAFLAEVIRYVSIALDDGFRAAFTSVKLRRMTAGVSRAAQDILFSSSGPRKSERNHFHIGKYDRTLERVDEISSERPYSVESACNLVLRGGLMNALIYPSAIVELARKYRFSSIGGTSAGAAVAAAAAASEYGRNTIGAGFDRMAKIPDELGPNLLTLFQPTPALRPLCGIFVAALQGKPRLAMIGAAIAGYWPSASLGSLPGVVVVALSMELGGGRGYTAFGLLLALTGLVVALIWRVSRAISRELAAEDFGICPGIRQPYHSDEGFTDWLARLIQEAAGRRPGDPPLTFGDLERPPGGAPPIKLAMMTTSLMEQRPYTLPLVQDRGFVFRKDEWERVFPASIISFLVNVCERFDPPDGEPGELYYFPDPARLPLVVGARMSLSFPGLISAVPLWRRDFTMIDEAQRNKLRRCLFSDGSLSGGLPVHFFDRVVPDQPTFAITVDNYDSRRNYDNVWLPMTPSAGIATPWQPFHGVAGLVGRLLDFSRNWQDYTTNVLPGYRSRIVHVVLREDETLSSVEIQQLASYGKSAGRKLRDNFDFDENRWQLFLVAMTKLERSLEELAASYEGSGSSESLRDFLARYVDPKTYKQRNDVRLEMIERVEELATLANSWRGDGISQRRRVPGLVANVEMPLVRDPLRSS
jgi:predicted acylesterase/phospholipase RssA